MQDETDLYLQSPLVEEGDYYCIFENENNSWCISTDSPMLNAGWTYSQKFDKVSVTLADKTSQPLNYYMITLLPYIQPYFQFTSIFNIQALYYNQWVAELKQFKAQAAFYGIYNFYGQICGGIGYNHDAITATTYMKSQFMQCSKTILDNLFDQTGVWTGPDAKWFENCAKTPSVQADFNTWNILPAVQQQIWIGTNYAHSAVYCYALPVVGTKGSSLNAISQRAYNNLGSYWFDKYSSSDQQESPFR